MDRAAIIRLAAAIDEREANERDRIGRAAGLNAKVVARAVGIERDALAAGVNDQVIGDEHLAEHIRDRTADRESDRVTVTITCSSITDCGVGARSHDGFAKRDLAVCGRVVVERGHHVVRGARASCHEAEKEEQPPESGGVGIQGFHLE